MPSLPLVYSCSGCSSAAQMANHLAIRLDRDQIAEMSCIAGIGGGVAAIVRQAGQQRKIIALDGCKLHCVTACLSRAQLHADLHLTLSDYGVRKRKHADFDAGEASAIYRQIKAHIRQLPDGAAPPPTAAAEPGPLRKT